MRHPVSNKAKSLPEDDILGQFSTQVSIPLGWNNPFIGVAYQMFALLFVTVAKLQL